MTQRKKILDLMNELVQNPSALRDFRRNPQSHVKRYEIDGTAGTQLLNRDWKGLNATCKGDDMPHIPMQDGTFGLVLSSTAGLYPRYR